LITRHWSLGGLLSWRPVSTFMEGGYAQVCRHFTVCERRLKCCWCVYKHNYRPTKSGNSYSKLMSLSPCVAAISVTINEKKRSSFSKYLCLSCIFSHFCAPPCRCDHYSKFERWTVSSPYCCVMRLSVEHHQRSAGVGHL